MGVAVTDEEYWGYKMLAYAVMGFIAPFFWLVIRTVALWLARKIFPRAEFVASRSVLFQVAGQLAPQDHWLNRPISRLFTRRRASSSMTAAREDPRLY